MTVPDTLLSWSTPTISEIHFAEARLTGEGHMRPPDAGGVRKVIKDYVGPDSPGAVILGGSSAGRHPNFDPATIERLTAALEPHARKRMISLGRCPTRDDRELMNTV